MRVDPKPIRVTAAILIPLWLGGCSDSLRRSDFLTDHTGDAVAANKAIHIVDPWRRGSFDTRVASDSARPAAAVGRYRSGEASAGPLPRASSATTQ